MSSLFFLLFVYAKKERRRKRRFVRFVSLEESGGKMRKCSLERRRGQRGSGVRFGREVEGVAYVLGEKLTGGSPPDDFD